MTDCVCHIVHAPDRFAAPAKVLGASDSYLSPEEFHRAGGVRLKAVGHMDSLDQGDPASPVDTHIAPPQCEGSDLEFLVAVLQADVVG